VAGRDAVPRRLAVAACAASVLPDADALGYWAGVPYDAPLGHRGFTHSFLFAALLAAAAAAFARRLGASRGVAFGAVFLAGASHGVLDALTTGGMGVAFLSPFSNARFFLPWRVIQVSPIGVGRFFSERGVRILRSELTWVWLPCAAAAGIGIAARRLLGRR
jgi:inner membrane protein